MIELRLIRNARALERHGSFVRAARELGLTQPSLSRSISALERALGVPLFDRSSRGVTPTAFGRLFLERGEAVLNREADLRRDIQLLAGLEEGSLSVGAGPYPAEGSVAEAVARIARAHPRLKIRLTSADPAEVVRGVLEERYDVGVAAVVGLETEERLRVEALPPERIFLACRPGHPLTREAGPTFARALEFPLVTALLRGAHAAAAASRGLSTAPGAPDFAPQIQVNTIAAGRRIARGSDALVPGTAGILEDDVAAGRLVRLECDSPVLRTTAGIVTLRDRTLAPAARKFIETLRAVEAEAAASAARTPVRAPRKARRSARRH